MRNSTELLDGVIDGIVKESEIGILQHLASAQRMAKSGGRGLELARREIDEVARKSAALSKEIWRLMNSLGKGSDAAGEAAEKAVNQAIKLALGRE